MTFWDDFRQACINCRDRWIRPDQIGRWLFLLLVFQLCMSPATMALGLTAYSLALAGALLLLALPFSLLLAMERQIGRASRRARAILSVVAVPSHK